MSKKQKSNNISIATTTRHVKTIIDPIIRPGAAESPLLPGTRVRIITRPYYSPSLKQMQRPTTGTVKAVYPSGCFVIRDGNKTASRFRLAEIEELEER